MLHQEKVLVPSPNTIFFFKMPYRTWHYEIFGPKTIPTEWLDTTFSNALVDKENHRIMQSFGLEKALKVISTWYCQVKIFRGRKSNLQNLLVCFIIPSEIFGMSLTLPDSLLAKDIIFLSTGQLWGKMLLVMIRDLKIWMSLYKYLST